MNALTKEIAKWLKISLEDAANVQDDMAIYFGADFSEDSTRTLKMLAKMAWAERQLHANYA